MVNPSTESILNQMTNLAMDIALDYVLPASPMSDVCKSDLFEFEREVVAAAVSGGMADGYVNSLAGATGALSGCCSRPTTDLCKKNSYMGTAGCDSCDACLSRRIAAAAAEYDGGSNNNHGLSLSSSTILSSSSTILSSSSTILSSSSTVLSSSTTTDVTVAAATTVLSAPATPVPSTTSAETTMDISWCQFDGCEFDTADNSYLDICDWIFYADRYTLTDENREKVQKAFQMVPPGEVTGYVAAEPLLQQQQQLQQQRRITTTTTKAAVAAFDCGDVEDLPVSAVAAVSMDDDEFAAVDRQRRIKAEIKSESDDDYLWTSDNHLQPIILKAEPDADIQQITELDHSYLQTPSTCNSAASSTVVSPAKHHHHHHHHHQQHLNVDLLGLVTPPPSRSQSSGE